MSRSCLQHNAVRAAALAAMLCIAAALLAACSAALVADHVPTAVGGLPEAAPQRSASPPAYPAVHDMPPARESSVLTDEEQRRLEADLAAARDRVGGQNSPTGKPAATTRKP